MSVDGPGIEALRDPVVFIALGFGSGLLPKAPGSWGSLVGVALYLVIAPLGGAAVWLAAALAIVVGVPICGRAARRLGVHDHPAIVWDEIAGVMLTLAFVPSAWPWLVAGLIAFRLFDIAKPWPIRWLDRHWGGGLGIMADDVAAGAVAGALLAAVAVAAAG